MTLQDINYGTAFQFINDKELGNKIPYLKTRYGTKTVLLVNLDTGYAAEADLELFDLRVEELNIFQKPKWE